MQHPASQPNGTAARTAGRAPTPPSQSGLVEELCQVLAEGRLPGEGGLDALLDSLEGRR